VLAGRRPEEIADWQAGAVVPAAALSVAASAEAQAQAIEQAIEQGRRVAARGGDAVVLIDGFAYLSEGRRAAGAVRGAQSGRGGSLTVVRPACAPVGGETTVVALDAEAAGLGSFPALSLKDSGTLRPELLVGEAGAQAIRAARAGEPFEPPVEPEPEPVSSPSRRGGAARREEAGGGEEAGAKKPAAAKKKPAPAKKPAAAKKKPAAAKKKPAKD
jgi:transcription termination factor Rho